MAKRLYIVTKNFVARGPGGPQNIRREMELWAEPEQQSSTTVFEIDNLDFKADAATFSSSTKLKNPD